MKNKLINYRKRYNENLFYKNIGVIVSGNILAKLIGVISAPIITRIYSPKDFGTFSLYLSIITILSSIATLRYSVTIPLSNNSKTRLNLLRISLISTIVFSLIVFTVLSILYLTKHYFDNTVLFSDLYFWFIPLIILFKGTYESFSYWLIRHDEYKLITKTKINQNIYSTLTKISSGLLGLKPLGLFLGQIILDSLGIFRFIKQTLKYEPFLFKKFNWRKLKITAHRYKKFPLIQTWSQLLLSFSSQLPVLLIAGLYNPAIVGGYGLAMSMVNLPLDILGQSISQVYYGEISKYGINNKLKIYELSISLIKKMLVIVIPFSVLIIIFSPLIFKVFFGEEWIEAGRYTQIIAIVIATRFISAPIMHCLNVLEKQKSQIILNISRILILIFVFQISYTLKFDIYKTLFIYSISQSLFYILTIKYFLSILKK